MDISTASGAFIRPSRFSPAEWQARVQLAAAYRIFDHLGWTELIYNHISLRVPDAPLAHFRRVLQKRIDAERLSTLAVAA